MSDDPIFREEAITLILRRIIAHLRQDGTWDAYREQIAKGNLSPLQMLADVGRFALEDSTALVIVSRLEEDARINVFRIVIAPVIPGELPWRSGYYLTHGNGRWYVSPIADPA